MQPERGIAWISAMLTPREQGPQRQAAHARRRAVRRGVANFKPAADNLRMNPTRPTGHATAQANAQASARERGFTLIELMITVVIVGILSALVFPSFMDSIRKSRRSDATQALAAVQQAQERRRANQAAYTTDLAGALPAGLAMTAGTPGGYYTISLPAADAAGYTVLAAFVSGKSQENDGACKHLRIRQAGGNLFYGSAATAAGPFDEAAGNRCWVR